jgi:TatD DNase family protein
MLRWCDSHCHVPWEGLAETAIEEARGAGVDRVITVGTDAARTAAAVALASAHDGVWATAGLHPHDAIEGVDTIVPFLDDPSVVAVGECGLDYHYDHSPRPVQREAFAAQIALARAHQLALVIHTREAWDDTFAILASEGVPERTVFHCFTGGAVEARRALDAGTHLSFSGIVTFKGADDVREAARLCPADRLLVETDAPYLAPAPHRGRRNHPMLLPVVGAALAAVRGEPVGVVADATWANAERLFALPPDA